MTRLRAMPAPMMPVPSTARSSSRDPPSVVDGPAPARRPSYPGLGLRHPVRSC
jgi:hypothetical protein